MKQPALDYYIHDGPTAFRLQLTGVMTGEGVGRLEQVWKTASSLFGSRRPIIDITFVTSVDDRGRSLLVEWHRAGAHVVAQSKTSRGLVESILGAPASESEPILLQRRPLRVCLFRWAASLPFFIAAFLLASPAKAANLKPETVSAWDNYVDQAEADLQRRIQPGGCFLWTMESADRAEKVHGGEIVVAPAPGPNPKNVRGGLIHHWIGAMFIPNRTIEQIVSVTRNYDRYKDYYQPSVIESRTVASGDTNDEFALRIMNKALFLKIALDADYRATYVRVEENRVYSISRTTRLQEIDDYGEAGEHAMPEGEGGGYIWKLFSIARLEQRDGGVYVELEAIALSREIPLAARFFVDPMVRRVSRNSMLVSLRETREALQGDTGFEPRRASIPLSAGRMGAFAAK
jgi:hypothetical protein